jgi:hypothetical protein
VRLSNFGEPEGKGASGGINRGLRNLNTEVNPKVLCPKGIFLTRFPVIRFLGTNRKTSRVRTRDLWKSARILWTFCRDGHIKTAQPCTAVSHQGGKIMRLKTLAAFGMTLLLLALALNVPVAAADQQSGT